MLGGTLALLVGRRSYAICYSQPNISWEVGSEWNEKCSNKIRDLFKVKLYTTRFGVWEGASKLILQCDTTLEASALAQTCVFILVIEINQINTSCHSGPNIWLTSFIYFSWWAYILARVAASAKILFCKEKNINVKLQELIVKLD